MEAHIGERNLRDFVRRLMITNRPLRERHSLPCCGFVMNSLTFGKTVAQINFFATRTVQYPSSRLNLSWNWYARLAENSREASVTC